MYLCQAYRTFSILLAPLLAVMMTAVSLPGPDESSLPPALLPCYVDFRMAQIKTLSFLTSLMKHQPDMMKPHAQVSEHREAVQDFLARKAKNMQPGLPCPWSCA